MFLLIVGCWLLLASVTNAQEKNLFGDKFPNLDSQSTGQWWDSQLPPARRIVNMDVPREQVVAFALYAQYAGTLKMTAQLFPLLPDEPRSVVLQLASDSGWVTVAESAVEYPGWDAHFRIDDWDEEREVRYRVVHSERGSFEGLIRRDPRDKTEIKVAVLSCNSSRTKGPREEMIDNLKAQDPDLLFFAGDQTYHHTEHTAGWLEWGLQFRDVIGDRPTITIPDDHDVGQANLWGESGKVAATPQGPDGGYFYPPAYVNMVQRQQTWHLPDPVDPQPVGGDITVYFTRMVLGGIDFAILEDRKFKSGPEGKIPEMGPRPDHIVDPAYDRQAIDLPELVLLGDRQHAFLSDWSQDWTGAEMKSVLSQTAFCGAVHLHGKPDNRLLADLDCNGWPQSGRNTALRLIRQAWATHLCGDQHLAVAVKHGIDEYGDGPYAFTVPAIVNTIYGRWWHPEDEQAGENAVPNSPLPWTGNYEDGLGNKLTMLAYANPKNVQDETERGDGYGLVRFNKATQQVTFECWPRFAKVSDGDPAQYPGWPITIDNANNDGRQVVGYLPPVELGDVERPVVQVINQSTSEILYTIRVPEKDYPLPVYHLGPHTIRAGTDRPDGTYQAGVMPVVAR
jgi:hypothetical protein